MLKKIMELANVVVDVQGTIPTGPRSDESETKGPLCQEMMPQQMTQHLGIDPTLT